MAQGDPATIEGTTAAWQETTEALRESERRYRELVESSLGLICTHDLTGTIISINSASTNSLGYQPGFGVGRNLRDFLSPDKRHLFDEYLRRIQEHGHDAGMMSVVATDGTTRVWMYRNVLSQHQDGTAYVLGHAIDITDRVAVERSLRHNIEQRETLTFLADFSDRLSPLVTFEEFVDVVHRLPVPFVADATMVHTADDDGSVRLAARHGNAAHEPALAGIATALIRAGNSAVTTERLDTSNAAIVPLVVDGSVKAVLSLVSETERRLRPDDDARTERFLTNAASRFPALQRLQILLAILDWRRGRPEAALDRIRRAADAQPNNIEGLLHRCELATLTGAPDAPRLTQALLAGSGEANARITGYSFKLLHAYHQHTAGQTVAAAMTMNEILKANQKAIDEGVEWAMPFLQNAAIHALRGETVAALDWLERAYDAGWRDARTSALDPLLASIRREPRFARFISRIEADVAAMRARADYTGLGFQ